MLLLESLNSDAITYHWICVANLLIHILEETVVAGSVIDELLPNLGDGF
jgi:hypothetical protein